MSDLEDLEAKLREADAARAHFDPNVPGWRRFERQRDFLQLLESAFPFQ